ncbi:MAG: hypothetical protein EXR58_04665 [Chloroflexi bacterium]|nr:hypothetical protein [Chloroflexota bacterium]
MDSQLDTTNFFDWFASPEFPFTRELIEQVVAMDEQVASDAGPVTGLSFSVVSWSELCALLTKRIAEILEEYPTEIAPELAFQLRMQFLTFFLAALAWKAEQLYGDVARVALLDSILGEATVELVRRSGKATGIDGDVDAVHQALDYGRDAQVAYQSCDQLEDGVGSSFNERTFVGKLGGQVCSLLSIDNETFRMSVARAGLVPIKVVPVLAGEQSSLLWLMSAALANIAEEHPL